MKTNRHRFLISFTRRFLLKVSGAAAMVVPVLPLVCTSVHGVGAFAQNTPASPHDIADTWQGTLHAGRDLRTVIKISKDDKGTYKGVLYSVDQEGATLPLDSVTLQGSDVKYSIKAIDGTFEGRLSADGKTIDGSWKQGPNPIPLVLTRATPETEWAIPTPPPPVPPMAADANPTFEVATIKPGTPDRQGKLFTVRGRHFITVNTNVNDLIAFAYGLHARQIIGAPDWFGTSLFDIDAVPDAEGRPNQKQMQVMVQKLLADRFQMKFHHDKKELSVYTISVGAGGPKLTKSTGGTNDPGGFMFRGLGDLVVRNLTMAEFATWMQSGVMDKPVVDQTGLTDKYDFTLKWTPDDSQFAQFRGTGATPPKPTDDPNAPPALYTAIQEQLGLKMGPGKAPDDVIVIDKAEKPSAN